jgi:molecular chaperone GrpE (heat shock protein)
MDRKEIEKKLREKLEANYRTYIQQLQTKPSADLIEQAAEIAAAKLVFEELCDGGYNLEQKEYLLRFQNPLEVVRDQWLKEQKTAMEDGIEYVLLKLADIIDIEQNYDLDEAFLLPEQEVRLC